MMALLVASEKYERLGGHPTRDSLGQYCGIKLSSTNVYISWLVRLDLLLPRTGNKVVEYVVTDLGRKVFHGEATLASAHSHMWVMEGTVVRSSIRHKGQQTKISEELDRYLHGHILTAPTYLERGAPRPPRLRLKPGRKPKVIVPLPPADMVMGWPARVTRTKPPAPKVVVNVVPEPLCYVAPPPRPRAAPPPPKPLPQPKPGKNLPAPMAALVLPPEPKPAVLKQNFTVPPKPPVLPPSSIRAPTKEMLMGGNAGHARHLRRKEP